MKSHLFCHTNEEINNDRFPLTYKEIASEQSKDLDLKTALKNNDKYQLSDYHGGDKVIKLICRNEKIVVPNPLQD